MSVAGMLQRLCGFGRHLAREESGAALIYVSVALTVFMGFAALVIDGSRLFTLDTELQSAADAIALAGAAELDGSSGAIDRAEDAMANLVQNDQTYGTGGAAITAYEARFLSELPADDAEPVTDDLLTTDDAEARFVEVRIQGEDRREINTIFATSIGGEATAMAGATAVAGFTSAVCKFTPLFMCNPYESTDPSLSYFSTQIADPAEKRKIIALKRSGAHAKYAPGNFGFLQTEADDTKFRDSLGKIDPGACFDNDGVETKTGSTVSARQPLNTRFDLYAGSYKNPTKYRDNPDYRPAQAVTKGYTAKNAGSVCKPDFDDTGTKALAFPVDSVIGSNRLGNGVWDFDRYWDMNHGNRNGTLETADDAPNSWSNSNLPSRYDVYRYEVEHASIPNKSPTGEDGNPQCYNGAKPTTLAEWDNPDRRIIYAAVLNCDAIGLTGGSDQNIPPLTFVKMFMTQPMTKEPGKDDDDEDAASDNTLYVEMIDIVKPGTDDEVVHDIVQLYR